MTSTLKTRLQMISYYWWINGRGILIVVSILVFLIGGYFYLVSWRSSPIIATSTVTGQVVSASTREIGLVKATGRGFSYRYGIRLENSDTVVFAVQGAARPIMMGTSVKLERIERQNGSLDYRFVDRTGR